MEEVGGVNQAVLVESRLGLKPCPTKRQGFATLRCSAHQVAGAGTAWLLPPPLSTAREPLALETSVQSWPCREVTEAHQVQD
jgi:hypothetical protein